jgi:gamma-glutamylcyclotransferase (GGCT)/AIG2-like uncharacterized protein YtfP
MPDIFAYGTLMFPAVAKAVTGIDDPGLPLTLTGYRRYEAKTRQRANFPVIIKEKTASVDGLLFQDLSQQQLDRLDWFEDVVDQLYIRKKIQTQFNGNDIEFWTFVCGPKLEKILLEPLTKSWNPVLFQNLQLEYYLAHTVNPAISSPEFKRLFLQG